MEPSIWHSKLPAFEPTPSFVDETLLAHADDFPTKVAVTTASGRRTITFAQLRDGARRLAAGLAERGVVRGEVVAIVAASQPDFPVAVCGALGAGATVQTANPGLTASEIERQLRLTGARLVFADPHSAGAVTEALGRLAGDIDLYMLGGSGGAPAMSELLRSPSPAGPSRDPDDLAFMFPSGGTTGLPKIAAHRHCGVSAWLQAFSRTPAVGLESTDVVAVLAPFTHMFGIALMIHALRSGASVVVPDAPGFELESYLAMLAAHRVTVAPVTPPVAIALARDPRVDRFDIARSLRLVILGAAPTRADVQDRLARRLDCRVADCLGATEAWCYAPAADPIVRGSVGALTANMEAILVDPDSGERVGVDEPGELWIRGPQVMAGYVRDERATSETLDAEGWLHTGDLCSIDGDGNVYILDRLKELIKVGGCSVAPAEVERELLAHPAVADAAVVGRPDPELGEVPVAYVVSRVPIDRDVLLGPWFEGRLASWKHPRDVVVVDQLPRTPLGKLARRELTERERGAMLAGR